MSLVARIDQAEVIAREAGALALDYFAKQAELNVARKGLQDTVSQADGAVEALIKQRLARAFPKTPSSARRAAIAPERALTN